MLTPLWSIAPDRGSVNLSATHGVLVLTEASADPSRPQGPITAAFCWAHARRQFFELADIPANAGRGKNAAAISPIALESVKRIDALFDIERGIKGRRAEERLRVRREQSAHQTGVVATLPMNEQHQGIADNIDNNLGYDRKNSLFCVSPEWRRDSPKLASGPGRAP
jgi:hypothetical protein